MPGWGRPLPLYQASMWKTWTGWRGPRPVTHVMLSVAAEEEIACGLEGGEVAFRPRRVGSLGQSVSDGEGEHQGRRLLADQHGHVPVATPAQGPFGGHVEGDRVGREQYRGADPLEVCRLGLALTPGQGVELGAVLALVPEARRGCDVGGVLEKLRLVSLLAALPEERRGGVGAGGP